MFSNGHKQPLGKWTPVTGLRLDTWHTTSHWRRTSKQQVELVKFVKWKGVHEKIGSQHYVIECQSNLKTFWIKANLWNPVFNQYIPNNSHLFKQIWTKATFAHPALQLKLLYCVILYRTAIVLPIRTTIIYHIYLSTSAIRSSQKILEKSLLAVSPHFDSSAARRRHHLRRLR